MRLGQSVLVQIFVFLMIVGLSSTGFRTTGLGSAQVLGQDPPSGENVVVQSPATDPHEGHDHAGHDHDGHQLANATDPNVKPEIVKMETEEFKRTCDALREHLKEMRKVIMSYHISESAVADREIKDQWPDLLRKGNQLHGEMMAAALAEFKLNPDGRMDLAAMFARYLKRGFEEDRFEGMVPVGQALVETGYSNPDILRFLAMAAFSTNEYEVAKPLLQQLVDSGEVSAELGVLIDNYEVVKEAWDKELQQRAADAAGEPLPRVLIKTTKGNIEIELFEDQAPETVANFIYLVEQGFYDNLTFHRVIEHFMAQTGCPQGDGRGDPGYFILNEADKPNARNFFRGTLGMALAEQRNTAGSQFFITFLPTLQLNGSFTAFGRVIAGFDVLSNINRINPEADENKQKAAPPVMPDEIVTLEILFKRDHDYKPNKIPK